MPEQVWPEGTEKLRCPVSVTRGVFDVTREVQPLWSPRAGLWCSPKLIAERRALAADAAAEG